MSQGSVERIMGRLLTDDEFRRRFAADADAALDEMRASGLELTPCELGALSRFDWKAAERCARAVDPRLLKADLLGGHRTSRSRGAHGAHSADPETTGESGNESAESSGRHSVSGIQ